MKSKCMKRLTLPALSLALVMPILASQERWTWTGDGANNNWTTPGNWIDVDGSDDDYPGETEAYVAIVTLADTHPRATVTQNDGGLAVLYEVAISDGHTLEVENQIDVLFRLAVRGTVTLNGDDQIVIGGDDDDNFGYVMARSESANITVTAGSSGSLPRILSLAGDAVAP